jgi:hypothetical protein
MFAAEIGHVPQSGCSSRAMPCLVARACGSSASLAKIEGQPRPNTANQDKLSLKEKLG